MFRNHVCTHAEHADTNSNKSTHLHWLVSAWQKRSQNTGGRGWDGAHTHTHAQTHKSKFAHVRSLFLRIVTVCRLIETKEESVCMSQLFARMCLLDSVWRCWLENVCMHVCWCVNVYLHFSFHPCSIYLSVSQSELSVLPSLECICFYVLGMVLGSILATYPYSASY